MTFEPKANRSIREHLENGNVSYNILANSFEKEHTDSCKTLYEVLMMLALKLHFSQNESSEKSHFASSNAPANTLDCQSQGIFYHMEFIVPLCLKSIVIRHCSHRPRSAGKVYVEKREFNLIEAFVGHLVRCLILLCKESSGEYDRRKSTLQSALQSSQIVLDFIVGLSSVVRARQVEALIFQFFQTLRDHETTSLHADTQKENATLNEEAIHEVRCSQHLRLFAAETLCTIPSFLALNVPMKYSVTNNPEVRKDATAWLTQYMGTIQGTLSSVDKSYETTHSGWLVDLVVKDCFCVCSVACQLVVNESIAIVEASKNLESNKSSLRKHLESTVSKFDLQSFHDTACQGISIVYELVVRRHSMDQRFQSESVQCRIAGLLTKTIIEQTCENWHWLEKLDSANQVRSTWLLCFVYVLQEAPEGLIYDFVRSSFESVSNFATDVP